MNYNSLFNLLYSTEISEATKSEIINRMEEPIQESAEVESLVETYLELLDTLVFSAASESLIYNIIDEAFSQLDEEFINEVSNEWVKRKVQDSMAARKATADSAEKSVKSGVIGLSQLRRQDKAQQNLEAGKAKADSIQARLDKRASAAPKVETKPRKHFALISACFGDGIISTFKDLGVDYVIEHLHEDDVKGCLEGAKITFLKPLIEDVQIIWEFDGLIEDDLTNQEILILAQGMVLAWVQTKVNREEHLRNYISDKDLKHLSSANMLEKLLLLEANTERKYRIAKQKYTYKGFGGLN